MSDIDYLLRLADAAAHIALERDHQAGETWCPACPRGGYDGPTMRAWDWAMSYLRPRMSVSDEIAVRAAFSRAWLDNSCAHLDHVPCERHRSQRTSSRRLQRRTALSFMCKPFRARRASHV